MRHVPALHPLPLPHTNSPRRDVIQDGLIENSRKTMKNLDAAIVASKRPAERRRADVNTTPVVGNSSRVN